MWTLFPVFQWHSSYFQSLVHQCLRHWLWSWSELQYARRCSLFDLLCFQLCPNPMENILPQSIQKGFPTQARKVLVSSSGSIFSVNKFSKFLLADRTFTTQRDSQQSPAFNSPCSSQTDTSRHILLQCLKKHDWEPSISNYMVIKKICKGNGK